MTQNVNGPQGPQGPYYAQNAQTITNNNYYYSAPPSYSQDQVCFSGQPQRPNNIVMIYYNNAANGVQQAGQQAQQMVAGPQYYDGACADPQLQAIFSQCNALMNAMNYQGQQPGCQSNPDRLSDLRAMQAWVNQQIADCTQGIDTQGTQQGQQTQQQDPNALTEKQQEKVIRAAAALHEAVDGLGTDEDTIFQVLEGLSPKEKAALQIAYANQYGNGDPDALRNDLSDDLSGGDQDRALKSLNDGAHKHAISAAIALHDAMEDLGTDEDTVKQIMDAASPAELREIEKVYDELYGDGETGKLRKDIKSDFGGSDGFWPGAGAGAAVGAGIGSFIPVIGTGIGAVAGGIIGGITGLFADPSKDERTDYISKLNQSITADDEDSE